jgi:hypothetical protein
MKISNFKFQISNSRSGQVLLIAIMLFASALTITLAVTFRSTTETQVTKLEEESQKALSAAEAGVEAALKSGTVDISTLLGAGSGFTGTASLSTSAGTTFVSPLVQQDQQYSFYLSVPDFTVTPPTFSSYWNGNLDIYFKSESNDISLELTFIDNNNNLTRYVIDQAGIISGGGTEYGFVLNSTPLEGFNFAYKTQSAFTINNYKMLIVRVLNGSTRLGLSSGVNLPTQGKTATSIANSVAGVTKKVQLFQSHPQIPVEFFVTTF